MRQYFKIILSVLIVFFMFTSKVNAAETININDLIENASVYNKTEVIIEGEAIGEFLERGDYGWINILDKTNAIGVWVTTTDAKLIQTYGNYDYKGDIVKITGTFYQTCPDHDGETDFHCTSIEIVENGYATQHSIPFTKIIILLILIIIALILLPFFLKKRAKVYII